MNNVSSAIRTVKTPVIPPVEEEESLGRLYDALIEAWDEDEMIYSSAAEWSEMTDLDLVALGPPLTREETWTDESGYNPTEEDLDFLERIETERSFGINARFV